MSYKVGDTVRIKEDLVVGKKYGNIEMLNGDMQDLRGTTGTIECADGDDYWVKDYWWAEEMLEPVIATEEIKKEMAGQPLMADSELPVAEVKVPTMLRAECLEQAKEIVCKDREQTYGKPEDNFEIIADLWGAYLQCDISAHDVAMCMALLKIARIRTGKYKPDNYIDLCGYSACACEIGGK